MASLKGDNANATSSDLSLAVTVFSAAVKSLLKKPQDFFDRQAPFHFSVNDVTKIEILVPIQPPIRAVFQKKDKQWVQMGLQNNQSSPKSEEMLNQFLLKLSRFEAVRFLDPKTVNVAKMDSHIRLFGKDEKVLFEMKWGNSVREKASGDEPEAVVLPVKTSLVKEALAIPEGLVTDLALQTLTK